jgi:hypothetical protein
LNAVRLLLEMNVQLTGKRLDEYFHVQGDMHLIEFPQLKKISTISTIHEIVEAADIREKALTLVFVSSGIREGSIEQLKVGDYTQIKTARRKAK